MSPEQSRRAAVWACVGDLVEVSVDVVLANDITAPISLREFESGRGARLGRRGRARRRPLCAEQGHQVRRTVQGDTRVRARAGDCAPLRCGAHGHQHLAASRASCCRATCGGAGSSHLHLRRAGRFRHRHGIDGHRRRDGDRQHLDARAETSVSVHGDAAALGGRQGLDPVRLGKSA